jgi:hypothetical protein
VSDESGVDGFVERVARRRAVASTRRSFLGRLGKVALVVAGGPALAATLGGGVAEARVCGQSGVSPLCDSFDCGATWGWCWYANGCCAGGLLKKICDCCAPLTPNPVGYCPPGTRVLCVVESCGADPRLQTATLSSLPTADPVALSVAFSRDAFPGAVPMAVVGDAESPVHAAIAGSLGRVVEGPVLLSGRGELAAAVAEELARLRVEFVTLAGPALAPGVAEALTARGIVVERVGDDPGDAPFSVAAARWSRGLTGARRAVVLAPGVAPAVAASAAAVAALHRLPLLVGGPDQVAAALAQPRPLRETFVVSADPAAAGGYPGGRSLAGATAEEQAARLATLQLELGGVPDRVVLGPSDAGNAALGLAGAPVLLHRPQQLDGVRDWLFAQRGGISSVRLAGALALPARRELQSILNEFEIHLLRGGPGEGLPVIPQPVEERPIGRARR